MSNLIKYICFVLSFSFLLISTSCKQITQVDKSINKIFKSQKKIERKSDKYKKNLGIEDDNPNADSSNDDSVGISGINSIEQKNMINQYGYLFELFNGKNPGKVIRYNYGDSIKSIYIRSDSNFRKILPDVEVFGWHPYWMDSNWESYPLDLLSTISYFSYKVDPNTGLCQNPEQLDTWENTDFVKKAKENKTRVLLTISCHGRKNVSDFLDNQNLWQILFQDVSQKIISKSADGIDINFENLPLNKRNEFIDFVRQISSHLKNEFENISLNEPFISVTIPSDNSKENYNIRRLNSVVDLLIIMGYDYNDTSIPSPVSPLLTEYGPNLSKTLDYYSNNGIDKSKTILALPYYGIMWNTTGTEDKDNINQINYQTSIERRLTYKEIKENFLSLSKNSYEVELDTLSMTNKYSIYFEDLSYKEIFYDDKFTLEKKYDLAMSQNFKGIGIWALGYDHGHDELWQLIDENFSDNEKIFYDPITELDGFPVKFTKLIVEQKNIFIAIAIYLCMAVIFAFTFLLSDWRVRQTISNSKIITFFFVLITFIFLIPITILIKELFWNFDVHINSETELFIAFFIGILTFYIGSKITYKGEIKP